MARKRNNKDEMLDLSNRVFPYSQVFEEAFPELSDGTIEYSQTGPRGMFSYPSRAHDEYLHTSFLSLAFPIIRCNESCRRGGFELYGTIREMILSRKTEGEYELNCAGFTGNLRPKNTSKPCRNTLRCRITVQYKSEREPQS